MCFYFVLHAHTVFLFCVTQYFCVILFVLTQDIRVFVMCWHVHTHFLHNIVLFPLLCLIVFSVAR